MVKAQPNPLVAQVRAARDGFLAATLPREKVNAVQAQVLGMNALYLVPIYLQVNSMEARVQQSIDEVQTQLQTVVDQFKEKTQALRHQMVSLQEQLAQPPVELMTLLDDLKAQFKLQVTRSRQALDDVLAQLDTLMAQAQQAVTTAILQPVQAQASVLSGLFTQVSSKASALTGQTQMSADQARAGAQDLDAKLSQFKSEVTGTLQQAQAAVQGAADQTLALRTNFEAAGQSVSSQPAASAGLLISLLSTALPLNQALVSTRDETVLHAKQASLASAQLQFAMNTARQHLTTLLDNALASVAPPADAAKNEQQKMTEQLALVTAKVEALQAEIKAASEEVEQQVLTAHQKVEIRRDEGQALIDATKTEVQRAKAQTEIARVDVVSAEALVDAAVISNGGKVVARPASSATKPAPAHTLETAAPAAASAALPTTAQVTLANTKKYPAAATPATPSPEESSGLGVGAATTDSTTHKTNSAQTNQAVSSMQAGQVSDTEADDGKAPSESFNMHAAGLDQLPSNAAVPVGIDISNGGKAVAHPASSATKLPSAHTLETAAPAAASAESPATAQVMPANTQKYSAAVIPATPSPGIGAASTDSTTYKRESTQTNRALPSTQAGQALDLDTAAGDDKAVSDSLDGQSVLPDKLPVEAAVPVDTDVVSNFKELKKGLALLSAQTEEINQKVTLSDVFPSQPTNDMTAFPSFPVQPPVSKGAQIKK